jgi:hypothetical protein
MSILNMSEFLPVEFTHLKKLNITKSLCPDLIFEFHEIHIHA